METTILNPQVVYVQATEPSDKTHKKQYIDVFTRELTEEENGTFDIGGGRLLLTEKARGLRKLVPTKKQLNPCLMLFVSVDSDITKQGIRDYITENWKKTDTDQLDNVLDSGNRSNLLDMVKHKVDEKHNKSFNKSFKKSDIEKLNTELSGLEVDNNGSN